MNTYDYLVTQLLTNAVQINCIVAIERIPTTAWRYSYSEVHVYGCTTTGRVFRQIPALAMPKGRTQERRVQSECYFKEESC